VRGILADANNQGQVEVLVRLLQEDWRGEIWDAMGVVRATFADFGLSQEASDLEVWEACQKNQFVLITGNRNAKGTDSLEATIRTRNTPSSLPVLTISDGERLMRDREYAERVADRLLGYLFEIDQHLGTGRLYLP
jgi:hypothetical protein